ncbi:MAG: Holliday junction branch migration protein RuvA [Dehalococcoidales bacterium]|nr:Holliday junction branch migration protein RuvA [Dehalococcoidales bacterium]
MIASLHGTLESLGSEGAVVNVNGLGFRVYMPTSTLSSLAGIGKVVHLHTHLHLREDSATIYGFATPDELRLFQTLISVSGLGPRLALAMLSAMSLEQLVMAIATANRELLTVVPGVGKKLAERLILELKDKVAVGWVSAPAIELAEANTDVLAALTALGYSAAEASRAVAGLPAGGEMTLEEKIKLALQYFGG